MRRNNRTSLLFMLISFTVLFLLAQLSLLLIQYSASTLINSIISSSLAAQLLNFKFILPLVTYLFLQLSAYAILIVCIYFSANAMGKLFSLSHQGTYFLGLFTWAITIYAMLSLNSYYFPHSFFAVIHTRFILFASVATSIFLICTPALFFFAKHLRYLAGSVVVVIALVFFAWHSDDPVPPVLPASSMNKPNVIIIGLDSLRPDAINATDTPAIHHFLQSSHVFTHAYTPLARTFPAWIALLTAVHPVHSGARANLVDATPIIKRDNLVKKLKTAGYFTIYGTDLPRFTDINESYGFDRIMQPQSGLAEFIIADVYDFPLSNLLLLMPGARTLFPYNYGNRSAAVTYDPEQFLQQVRASLANRPPQPVFLAVHLCIAHWPHTFARDGEHDHDFMDQRYQTSVKTLDTQFAGLLNMLSQQHLLDSSIIVLMSDHGVTLGMPGDRLISKDKFIGKKHQLDQISSFKLNHTPEITMDFKKDYTISTSYGMGTDILSLNQTHIVLAFKSHDSTIKPAQDAALVSLVDVAPTIVNYLHLPALQHIDGAVYNLTSNRNASHLIFMETGDRLAAMDKSDISKVSVVKEAIAMYDINPATGLLTIKKSLLPLFINSKQHAVIKGNWMLARYPQGYVMGLVPIKNKPRMYELGSVFKPSYYVLLNLKTGAWTMDLSQPFAKPVAAQLKQQLKKFYGNEITS